ncbi:segregation and condensation protein B [Luteibacter sp. Sphag1AF]|uniref:SMC-Scp complex subunit ScpB n=1 Tax=Luteibacter sp. Sphag1AF TaxID=2587031 RepID=UPI0016208049|nr:SMC-Scp complex subunit ScpB [Luteibacter sp. Sphag1AF]MBB3227075.1 segregation and condensation protein B [Luteibacter sp. Sphag1AF]
MQPDQLKPIVEAALLASTQPMTITQLKALFVDEDEVSTDDLDVALKALAEDCDGRGVELIEVASGFRYQVRQHVHTWVSRLWAEKPSRYSRALLETLALIAYRQPITRPEIEQIRGVVVSSSIIKTLEEREWIRIVGYRDVPGKPALFGTTRGFLDYFNLRSLDALPPLSEIRDLEELNPQMRLNGESEPLPARVQVPMDDVATDEPIQDDPDEAIVTATPDASVVEASEEIAVTDVEDSTNDTDAPHDTPADANDVAASHTADEAENLADVDDDAATQDTEEFRA